MHINTVIRCIRGLRLTRARAFFFFFAQIYRYTRGGQPLLSFICAPRCTHSYIYWLYIIPYSVGLWYIFLDLSAVGSSVFFFFFDVKPSRSRARARTQMMMMIMMGRDGLQMNFKWFRPKTSFNVNFIFFRHLNNTIKCRPYGHNICVRVFCVRWYSLPDFSSYHCHRIDSSYIKLYI